MKYQFLINGIPYTAEDLSIFLLTDLMEREDWTDLLNGKIIELDSFVSEDGVDELQLIKV